MFGEQRRKQDLQQLGITEEIQPLSVQIQGNADL